MKKIGAILSFVSLLATAFVQTAEAQPRRQAGAAGQTYGYHNRGYYSQNGTRYYDGYPLRDWEKCGAAGKRSF
jgi:hypothetical protein